MVFWNVSQPNKMSCKTLTLPLNDTKLDYAAPKYTGGEGKESTMKI